MNLNVSFYLVEVGIFANFEVEQLTVISTTNCYMQHSVNHQRVGSKLTE